MTTTAPHPPIIHPATLAIARTLRDDVSAATDMDTLNRCRWRVGVTFAAFYDDEPGEPDQAIRDVLTDLMHEADARGVDFFRALELAGVMAELERAEWAERAAWATETEAGK